MASKDKLVHNTNFISNGGEQNEDINEALMTEAYSTQLIYKTSFCWSNFI